MLDRMAREHLGQPIICLGDDYPIRTYEGWWAKIELFAPWNEHLRPCVYFDLDTYILDDCRELLQSTDTFWMVKDFCNKYTDTSSVMVIPKDTRRIWENHFSWSKPKIDGMFLFCQPHRRLNDRFKGITSFKVHNTPSRIVCFHGEPKPHNVSGWAGEVWKKYTWPPGFP